MTVTEMSNQFDLLYNNITSNNAPGCDEYEKSVFLTKAQDEVVKNHFTPESKGNTLGKGYDGNQKRQADFSMLMVSAMLEQKELATKYHFDPRSLMFVWPEDVFLMVNEQVAFRSSTASILRQVIPLTYEDYTRLMSKPYKQPLKNQAWRLLTGSTLSLTTGVDYTGKVAEIIITSPDYSKYCKKDSSGKSEYSLYYNVRYVKRPDPIVLVDLDGYSGDGGNLSINGVNVATECKLDPILHEEILQRAVELAKTAWLATDANGMQAELTAGQRSE